MHANGDRARAGWGSAIGCGAGLFAALGGVLAGFAATLDWPIVGTFFGVIEGAVVGAGFGVVVAVLLASLARVTLSLWAARVASGAAAGAVALLAAAVYTGPIDLQRPLTPVLISVAAIVGGMFGPLIAFGIDRAPRRQPATGMEPAPGGRVATGLGGQLLRFLVWGASLGAGVGAVTGVVIGIRTYLPTAGFAAVEGAAFGTVSGLMLASLAAGALLLPRVRARR